MSKVVRNTETGQIIVSGIQKNWEMSFEGRLYDVAKYKVETSNEVVKEPTGKLVGVDNYDRDYVSDVLVAEACNLTKEESRELIGLLNPGQRFDTYITVKAPDYKLYEGDL